MTFIIIIILFDIFFLFPSIYRCHYRWWRYFRLLFCFFHHNDAFHAIDDHAERRSSSMFSPDADWWLLHWCLSIIIRMTHFDAADYYYYITDIYFSDDMTMTLIFLLHCLRKRADDTMSDDYRHQSRLICWRRRCRFSFIFHYLMPVEMFHIRRRLSFSIDATPHFPSCRHYYWYDDIFAAFFAIFHDFITITFSF